METISRINAVLAVLFAVCCSYQLFYIFVTAFKRKPRTKNVIHMNRYAVLIAARNEENVIGGLIESIKNQDYPSGLVDIFVVADNCTDSTAQTAASAGAVVWPRLDTTYVGKGYALDFLLERIFAEYPGDRYDAFLVFDADNLLDEHYITEMNRTFGEGCRIITSRRNSKNYGDNWITAGYSLWFLRESQYLNRSRYALNTSCAVSGTGFLVAREILEENGGWPFFLLTEDIEFTVHSILNGHRIGYCENAVFYDEQPTTFKKSCRQRLRWAKGYLQVFKKYGASLLGGIFSGGGFSCFDMTMNIMPFAVISVLGFVVNFVSFLVLLFGGGGAADVLLSAGESFLQAYLMLWAIGAITVVTEWKTIHCRAVKKVLHTFTFPLFMFTYIPISIAALFRKVEWAPIEHTDAKTLEDVRNAG